MSDDATKPVFDAHFRQKLAELFAWRRDVRRFRPDPVDPALLDDLLRQAALAPSVGFSQPWRFVLVEDPDRREAICQNFETENARALAAYSGERAQQYARLKLSGLREAPIHLAAFAEMAPERGHGVGRRTMPETVPYSVVTAVYTFWLAARAAELGVGWVSILDPDAAARTLAVPEDWRLVAYLCVGYPAETHSDPELERYGWESRVAVEDCIYRR